MGEEADNNSLGKMRGLINASWKTRDAWAPTNAGLPQTTPTRSFIRIRTADYNAPKRCFDAPLQPVVRALNTMSTEATSLTDSSSLETAPREAGAHERPATCPLREKG